MTDEKDEKKDWYDNKDLYEMMVDLSKGLEKTNAELAKTQVLIRDYNGLRQRITDCEAKQNESQGAKTGGKDMWGYIFGAAMFLLAVASYLTK